MIAKAKINFLLDILNENLCNLLEQCFKDSIREKYEFSFPEGNKKLWYIESNLIPK